MKERPILFSAPMVRAILAGTKTQTRRAAKLTANGHVKESGGHRRWHPGDPDARLACPYGQPGDRLWVRETWAAPHSDDARPPRSIHCDWTQIHYAATEERGGLMWRPSIHMPRWASRITLEITGVRVERLKDISEDDAVAEGIECHEHAVGTIGTRVDTVRCIHCGSLRRDHVGVAMACFGGSGTVWNGNTARGGFSFLWESINGAGSWEANPWVWVVEFKRVEGSAA